jgi:hypothetical protein
MHLELDKHWVSVEYLVYKDLVCSFGQPLLHLSNILHHYLVFNLLIHLYRYFRLQVIVHSIVLLSPINWIVDEALVLYLICELYGHAHTANVLQLHLVNFIAPLLIEDQLVICFLDFPKVCSFQHLFLLMVVPLYFILLEVHHI